MDLALQFPHIGHEPSEECCGCIRPVPGDPGETVLACNECGVVVGKVNTRVLEDLVALIP